MILLTMLMLSSAALINKTAAQVKVSLNVNIGSQPVWGPVGYDYVQYYYMPDINVYYYVPTAQFVYFEAGHWIFASSLPVRYRNYDLYRGYKVVINQPKAYVYNSTHKTTYVKYRGYYGKQVVILDSKDPKYVTVNRSHANNHGNGHDKHNR